MYYWGLSDIITLYYFSPFSPVMSNLLGGHLQRVLLWLNLYEQVSMPAQRSVHLSLELTVLLEILMITITVPQEWGQCINKVKLLLSLPLFKVFKAGVGKLFLYRGRYKYFTFCEPVILVFWLLFINTLKIYKQFFCLWTVLKKAEG